jgi:membrane protease YdiL (CAAX protease family)
MDSVYSFILGLSYGLAAVQTGSIAWPVISHSLHDTLGLGAFAYAASLSRSADAEVAS